MKLAPFNGGAPLAAVRLDLVDDDEPVVGLLERETDDAYVLRVWPLVLCATYPKRGVVRMQPVHERRPPEAASDERRGGVLGGVGVHTRRETYADSQTGDVGAIVANFGGDVDALRRAITPFGERTRFCSEPPELFEEEGTTMCALVVAGATLPCLTYELGALGFVLHCPNVREATIMPDSPNRAKHLYSQQLKYVPLARVGPTRALWRFRFSHLPPGCRVLPFSWPAWAAIAVDQMTERGELHRIDELELPLRVWVHAERVERRREELRAAEHERQELWEEQRVVKQREAFVDDRRRRATLRARVDERRRRALASDDVDEDEDAAKTLRREWIDIADEEVQLESDRHLARDRLARCQLTLEAQGDDDGPGFDDLPQYVTPALSAAQSAEQIDAFHAYYYNHRNLSADERAAWLARLLHAPLTTGFFPVRKPPFPPVPDLLSHVHT